LSRIELRSAISWEVLSLSKADAQRLLSMPRQAWENNVAHAVIAGTAQRTGGKPPSPASPIMLGLYTPTHDGFVLRPTLSEPIGMLTKNTRRGRDQGDTRPSRIWGACRGPRALTTSVNEVRFYLDSWPALARAPQSDVQKKSIAELQSQMAPEFDVSGHFERTPLGDLLFLFAITASSSNESGTAAAVHAPCPVAEYNGRWIKRRSGIRKVA
jgi:hypothetical protein